MDSAGFVEEEDLRQTRRERRETSNSVFMDSILQRTHIPLISAREKLSEEGFILVDDGTPSLLKEALTSRKSKPKGLFMSQAATNNKTTVNN